MKFGGDWKRTQHTRNEVHLMDGVDLAFDKLGFHLNVDGFLLWNQYTFRCWTTEANISCDGVFRVDIFLDEVNICDGIF